MLLRYRVLLVPRTLDNLMLVRAEIQREIGTLSPNYLAFAGHDAQQLHEWAIQCGRSTASLLSWNKLQSMPFEWLQKNPVSLYMGHYDALCSEEWTRLMYLLEKGCIDRMYSVGTPCWYKWPDYVHTDFIANTISH